MQETARPIEPEIVALIERTVRERMGPYALRTIDVRAGEDHDGDPVIYIQVRHDLSETPIDPQVNAKLSFDLWQLLLNAGETRFPHVRPKYHEQQKVKTRWRGNA
ncbi:MAG TPA: hypothetical protein VN524_19645 [Hyphomicrobiaceae bacterium]|jgi:hypothetical protein|nr:hypothetical protein [Hyphomicrobiaceae bacterium]